MSYKLEYPYTEEQRIDFIAQYNHQQGLKIETVEKSIVEDDVEISYIQYYALEKNEIMVNEEPVIDPDYEAKQEQKERQRIALLSLTRGDVFRGLLLARNVTRQQLRTMIETNPQLTDMQREMALIDFDEALNFYRGNTLIDTVGLALGIEPEQLDCFFETNDYTCLFPKVEPEEQPIEEIIEEPDVDNSEELAEENLDVAETEADEV